MSVALELPRTGRLAAPTSAIEASPEPLRPPVFLPVGPEENDLVDGVTAVADQARHLVERHPTSPAAAARLAHALLGNADEVGAKRAARRALQLAATSSDDAAVLAAVRVFAATGETLAAEEAMAHLPAHRFTHLFARFAVERGDLDLALARLEGGEDYASQTLRGWILLKLDRYHASIAAFRDALRVGAGSPDLYINLGYAYGAVGSVNKAITATKVAVHTSPTSRTASYNLAAFHALDGSPDEALGVLCTLRDFYPDALAPQFAIAEVQARFGDLVGAERTLRRAASSRAAWAADVDERAELRANLTMVEFSLGKVSLDGARQRIVKALQATDYRSGNIARMVPLWFTKPSEADELDFLLAELSRHHSSDSLLRYRAWIAYLRCDFDATLEFASAWNKTEPFDRQAAALLTFLLVEYKRDMAGAISAGKEALRRIPDEPLLRNNVAFAFAQLGQTTEARRMLGGHILENPVMWATWGFIELKDGNFDAGLAAYERAAKEATDGDDQVLADMIRHRAAIEATNHGLPAPYDAPKIAARYANDPRMRVLFAGKDFF